MMSKMTRLEAIRRILFELT